MIILIPAYGRKYLNESAAMADWNGGKDFKMQHGPYTSVRDIDLLHKDYGQVKIWWSYPYGSLSVTV